jgi:hypothetical protein
MMTSIMQRYREQPQDSQSLSTPQAQSPWARFTGLCNWVYFMVLVLGGCTWSPFAPDKDKDKGDAGSTDAAAEVEHCTLKVGACNNSCYKAGAGSSCRDCCRQNGKACDNGESYSFYSCPDVE